MFLTVFTSTYNRGNLLNRIFESLLLQNRDDIEWLVVDDGSDDDTPRIVAGFAQISPFPVRYFRQARGGKHRAYNEALRYAVGEFFLTLDSDDWLPAGAVDAIGRYAPVLQGAPGLCGMIGLKADSGGVVFGKKLANGILEANDRRNYNIATSHGERCIVLKTDIARKYPFPEVDNEMFITESVVFSRIGISYGFYLINIVLSYCEYQTNGLTQQIHSLLYHNPVGFMLFHSQCIDYATNFKSAFKSAVRYVSFRSIAGAASREAVHSGRYRWLVRLLAPLGPIGKLYYRFRSK